MKKLGSFVACGSLLLVALVGAQGCGARTRLLGCERDGDCADSRDLCTQFACIAEACTVVSHTLCDDHDPCTDDSCNKKEGTCLFTHQTYDLDKDGHYAPKEGFDPGAPGSCGDDCDDTDPNAYPGNKEICDGVDNDCNGIIDDGATYTPGVFGSEQQISESEVDYAEPEHVTRGGSALLAGYSASRNGQFSPEDRLLDSSGKPTTPPFRLTKVDASGSNASAVWTGDRWGVVWSDRRDGNYEIYFAALDAQGQKLSPGDERITVSRGFSLYPRIAWTGREFVFVWQEEIENVRFKVQGQRVALDGTLDGDIAELTPGGIGDQGPSIASGRKELGIAWVRGDTTDHRVMFQTLDFAMKAKAPAVNVTPGSIQGDYPEVAFNRTSYVLGFSDPRAGKRAVFAAVASTDGTLVVPPTTIALPGANQRDVSLLALGDRVVFVYSDDRDANKGYELYARTLWSDLGALSAPARVTSAIGDSIGATVAFASTGSVIAVFRDDRGDAPAVFSTALACKMP